MNVSLWMELVLTVFVVAASIVIMRTCSRVETCMLALLEKKAEAEAAPVSPPRRRRTAQATKKATHVCVACSLPLPADPTNVQLKDGIETFVYACSCGTEFRSARPLSEQLGDERV